MITTGQKGARCEGKSRQGRSENGARGVRDQHAGGDPAGVWGISARADGRDCGLNGVFGVPVMLH